MPPQRFKQRGVFHVITNTRGRMPWCTFPGIPEILIDNLNMTRNLHDACIYAFCILPDHIHIVMKPGMKGLSAFMHSFKRNSSWHVRQCMFTTTAAGVHVSRFPMRMKPENLPFRRTAAEVHEPLLRTRKFRNVIIESDDICWQKSFHDELIRDAAQRSNALTYVQFNAWRHGLTDDPEGWPWSSLRFPQLLDSTEI